MAATTAALLCLLLLGSAARPPAVRLVWNPSASSPTGLYRIYPGELPKRGEMALAWAPPAARQLAAERHYLPRNVPLVKRAAATAGDQVCAGGTRLTRNGQPLLRRRAADPKARALPWWNGCRRLGPGELLLANPASPLAFDGRYFGITRAADVAGRAELLWRW